MTVSLTAKYEISQAIELLKDTDDFADKEKVLSMDDVETSDRKQRQAWQRIFDFRQAMKEREVPKWDERAKKLLATYRRYHCTQSEAHRLTRIPMNAINRITRYIPAVQKAYQKARSYRKNQARQARRRKLAKNDQV